MSETYPVVFHTYMYIVVYDTGGVRVHSTKHHICSFETADRYRFHQKFEAALLPVERRFSNSTQ